MKSSNPHLLWCAFRRRSAASAAGQATEMPPGIPLAAATVLGALLASPHLQHTQLRTASKHRTATFLILLQILQLRIKLFALLLPHVCEGGHRRPSDFDAARAGG